MATSKTATLVADVHAVLGEGPVWVEREQALYWVDIKGYKVFRHSPADGALKTWETPYRVCSLAPRASDGFIAGTEDGFSRVDLEADRFVPLVNPEPDRITNRFNDGKLDRAGRFWAGTMDNDEVEASGGLYRLDPDRSWVRVDDGYKVTNGPAFSPDGRLMYHNDSARQVTYLFDLDDSGNAANRRVHLQFGEGDGYPDGMTVDGEGCLWIAFWDGWSVRRFSPEGELIGRIEVPTARPTSCVFGGPALDQLFITSASIGISGEELAMQPNAGGLFMVLPGVAGIADTPFGG
ncbi:MAG TPA: SMP-30/gluconolactonase/LRE family protein [Allosphingosinicella sp.]|jgi:sugar lactone lactonase YvrE|uniref:SMP-30/gluconolactonase/LRE family protein n=1 Tax=Allosphingosinicella sp. TaxID=2823234 RepID=UPI002F2A9D87